MSYFNPETIPAELAYNCCRGVENLDSGHRTRKTCGFFVFTPCHLPINGREGMEIPEYHPPSITVSNLLAALFGLPLPLRKIDRTPAMMATHAVCLPVVCLSLASQEVWV